MRIIFIVLSLLSATAIANDVTGPAEVTEIWAGYKDQYLLFKTSDTHINPKGCVASYYVVREGDADLKAIFSILLSAQKSGTKVRIGVNPEACDSSGRISVTRVASLQ